MLPSIGRLLTSAKKKDLTKSTAKNIANSILYEKTDANKALFASFASNDVLYALMFYLSLFVILTLFVSWYLCQISSLAIYILTKEESEPIED